MWKPHYGCPNGLKKQGECSQTLNDNVSQMGLLISIDWSMLKKLGKVLAILLLKM